MATENKCPHCGKAVPLTALGGICPECMLKAGLAAETREIGPGGTVVTKPNPQPPPRVEEIAQHFPQFEILDCLGRGGMGVVYKARQRSLDRVVALKILAPEKEKAPQFAERFSREARTLAKLNHPNIVTVHDFGETNGMFYLVMEFVDGVNLRQLLRDRRLAPEEALGIVPPVCQALQYAHDQGIVHRDIKPENLLLDKQGRVKIADFGIAKILGRSEPGAGETREVLGTPQYMAPEQVQQPQRVDHRADIYSLGIVLYEMLTGELPATKLQPPSKKVQVDVRIDEIVLRALEKEPELRFQTATEFRTQVETVSTMAPVHGQASRSQTEGDRAATTGRGAFDPRKMPWQVWVVIGVLALEGLGNLLAIPKQPQALIWLAAKVLFITGLLRRWRPVYVLTMVVAGAHVMHFAAPSPVAALLNLILIVLLAYVYRFYFPRVETAVPLGRGAKVLIGIGVTGGVMALVLVVMFAAYFTRARATRAEALAREAQVREAEVVALAARKRAESASVVSINELSARKTPPVVVKTFPESGATDVDPSLRELRVTFSKPMRDGSWSWVKVNDATFPKMTAAPRFLSDDQICVVPVQLQPGKLYAIWLNFGEARNFQAATGEAALPYLLIFETRK